MRRAVPAALAALALLAGWRMWRAPPAPPAPQASARLVLLEEVLRSGNDNDPRLDGSFDGLSAEDKRLLRERYRSLAPERRNQRGTVVYLLGRNLASAEDWAFLREVASEPPCLSLADCSRPPAGPADAAGADEVTLAYPSLVALRQAREALDKGAGPEAAREARGVLAAGAASRVPAVARSAARLAAR